jgi:DNA-binding SARP family transcriptional activator
MGGGVRAGLGSRLHQLGWSRSERLQRSGRVATIVGGRNWGVIGASAFGKTPLRPRYPWGVLRVRLVGGLALTVDGEEQASLSGRPARQMLAWLALNPGRHARGTLAGTFWPDVLESSARASLRTALAVLRRELPSSSADWLVVSNESIALAVEVLVDVLEAASLADSGALAEALAMGDGELLPEFDEDWVIDARARHRDWRMRTLAARADQLERDGDPLQAIALSRRRIMLDPLDEDAHRDLITCLAERGDRAGALAVYARLQERLRSELGITPSVITPELIERLKIEMPAVPEQVSGHVGLDKLSAGGGDGSSSAARLQSRANPLIGRGCVVAELLRTLADPGVSLITLTGIGGAGKTSLAAEVARQANSEFAAGVVFIPLAEVLEPSLLPGELARLLGIHVPPGGPPLDAVKAALRTHRMLLLLDNFEQLLDAASTSLR